MYDFARNIHVGNRMFHGEKMGKCEYYDITQRKKIALKYFFVSSIPTWNLLMKTILLKGTCDEETGND